MLRRASVTSHTSGVTGQSDSRAMTPSSARRVVVVAPSEESFQDVIQAPAAPPPRAGGVGGRGRGRGRGVGGGGRGGGAGGGAGAGKVPKWKAESEALRRQIAGGGGGAPTSQAERDASDGRVACPHCMRRFNPQAAERHIAVCQKLQTKKRAVGGRTVVAAHRGGWGEPR